MFFASRTGDFELASTLLNQDSNIDVNAFDNEGNSALHWAVYNNHFKIVKLLLDKGANANCVNTKEFQTPLHWGSITGSVESIKILLDEGHADPLLGDKRGYTSFHLAASHNQLNLLHYLILKYIRITDGNIHAEKLVNCVDKKGRSPLHWSCYKGYERITIYLIRQGADINLADSTGMLPLHWAAQRGHTTIVNILLSEGSKVTAVDAKGNTPQDLSIKKRHFSIANLLGRASVQPFDRKTLDTPFVYRLWFSAPFIYLFAFMSIISYYSFIPSIFLCFSSYLIIKIFLNRYWLTKNYRNPLFMGWFSALFVLSAIAYYGYIIPESYKTNPLPHIIFNISTYTMVFLLISLTIRDPGYIIRDKNKEAQTFIDELEKGKKTKLCATCLHRIPIRGKHCRSCNKCVSKLDHHCGWINHCVGQKNHKRFLLFVFLLSSSSLWFARFIYLYLSSVYEISGLFNFILSIPKIYHYTPIYLFLMLAHIAFALYEAYVFYEQITLILQNMLMSEAVNHTKVTYFWSDGQYQNPFDNGPSKNLIAFLKNSIDWSNVYNVQDAIESYSIA